MDVRLRPSGKSVNKLLVAVGLGTACAFGLHGNWLHAFYTVIAQVFQVSIYVMGTVLERLMDMDDQ